MGGVSRAIRPELESRILDNEVVASVLVGTARLRGAEVSADLVAIGDLAVTGYSPRESAQGTGSPIPSMLPSLSRNQAARSPTPLLG